VHTLYVDKPMKGHNLMQAIARVNRVFKLKFRCSLWQPNLAKNLDLCGLQA
jgi:hypothetical protein